MNIGYFNYCLIYLTNKNDHFAIKKKKKTKEILKDDFDYTDLSPHTVTLRVKGFHKRVKFIHSSQNLLSRDWEEGSARKWRTASMGLLN